MKQTRFKKIVEYEKKINYGSLFGSITCLFLYIGHFYTLPSVSGVFAIMFLLYGVDFISYFFKPNRQVYWEEEKN